MNEIIDVDFDSDTEWDTNLDLTATQQNNVNFIVEQSNENDVKGLEKKHIAVLSRCFGHKKFRTLQWKIIRSIIIEKKDVCAIMATGYGKSLCYQFPSVFSGGVTIVVSPLISLMEDQVLSLKMSNIPACLLGSAQTQKSKVLSDIMSNEYRIIYATPEFCTGDYGLDFLQRVNNTLNVDLLAIDEAHCVSQWGHDFRVKYRHLAKIRNILNNVPVLAVTATATQDVRKDIIQSLKLRNPNVYCSGFDRPNLFFEVVLRKHSEPIDNLRPFMVRNHEGLNFTGSTIIYCLTKKQTEEVAKSLTFHQVKCLPYHASLSMTERKKAHEMFAKDKVKVIVATIAFGMGIDKPDVRMVIHYGASKDIEGYYQEVGRAGRDGLPSRCILLHSSADFLVHENLREFGGYSSSAKQKEHRVEMSKLMQKYIDTLQCRRKFILDYFRDEMSSRKISKNNCCDNCKMQEASGSNFYENYEGLDVNGKYNFAEEARLYLGVVRDLNGKYGAIVYMLTLRGSKSAKVNNICQRSPMYGKGKEHSEDWLKSVGSLLEREGYLKKVRHSKGTFSYSTIDLSPKGETLLRKLMQNPDFEFRVSPTKEMAAVLKAKKPAPLPMASQSKNWSDVSSSSNTKLSNTQKESLKIQEIKNEQEEDPAHKKYRMDLYNKLIAKRSDIAYERECMPYMVGSNTALMQMSKLRPKTIQQLKSQPYDGFTEAKIQNFGKIYVDFIKQYCEKNPPPDSDDADVTLVNEEDLNFSTCSFDEPFDDFEPKKDNKGTQNIADTTDARIDAFQDLLMENLEFTEEEWGEWNGEETSNEVPKEVTKPKSTKLPENVIVSETKRQRTSQDTSEISSKKQKLPEIKPLSLKAAAKKKKSGWSWD